MLDITSLARVPLNFGASNGKTRGGFASEYSTCIFYTILLIADSSKVNKSIKTLRSRLPFRTSTQTEVLVTLSIIIKTVVEKPIPTPIKIAMHHYFSH